MKIFERGGRTIFDGFFLKEGFESGRKGMFGGRRSGGCDAGAGEFKESDLLETGGIEGLPGSDGIGADGGIKGESGGAMGEESLV